MTLAERIHAMAEALPTESARVELSKADLLAMLEESGAATCTGSADQEHLMDLSVSDIMAATGKARSTVTGWINSGSLDAYKFNGREWRVPRESWRGFLRRQSGGGSDPEPAVELRTVDISSWRSVVGGGSR